MKKLLSLFLVFALIFAFGLILGSCSCSGNSDDNENQSLKWDTSRNVLKMEVIDGNLYVTYEDDQNNPVNLGKLLNGEVEWTTTLSFHPLQDGTYGVKVGNAKELSDIVIPSEFNSGAVTKIMAEGFKDCGNLKNLTIPSSVNAVMENAFTNCSVEVVNAPPCAITSLPKDTVKKVTVNSGMLNDEGMFASFTVLTDVVISKDVSSILAWAFNGCDTITTYTVEAGNEHYTSINGNIFTFDERAIVRYANGKTDTILDIPNTVLYIVDDAFNGCKNIVSVTISNEIQYIESNAFSGCTSLETITIGANVKNVGKNAFKNCPIKNATIPANVISLMPNTIETLTINGGKSIDSLSFKLLSSLTSVEFGETIESIGEDALYECSLLNNISVNKNNQFYKSVNGNLYSKDGTKLIQYAVGKKDASFDIPNSVTHIGRYAFFNCTSLTSVTIPNGVTTIDEGAFALCSSLANIEFPSSVTSIGMLAFANCTSITSVEVPNTVTDIGNGVFQFCTNLETVKYSCETMSKGAFWGCEKLVTVELSNNVKTIGAAAFESCTSLKEIVIPISVVNVENHIFYKCLDITIYCEAESLPSNWDKDWNINNCDVLWGYNKD